MSVTYLPDRSLDQLQRLGSIAQPIRNRHWLMPQPRRTQMAGTCISRPVHLVWSCHGYLTFPEGTNNPIALKVISHSDKTVHVSWP